MTRSRFVFTATASGRTAVPSRVADSAVLPEVADQWRGARELRPRLEERFVAEDTRTPLPLRAGAAPAVSR